MSDDQVYVNPFSKASVVFLKAHSLRFDGSNDPVSMITISKFPSIDLVLVVFKKSSKPMFSKIVSLVEPLKIKKIHCHLHPLWVGEIEFEDPDKSSKFDNFLENCEFATRCAIFRGCFMQNCEGYGNPKTGLCSLCKDKQFDFHVPILDNSVSIRLTKVLSPNPKVMFPTLNISLWQPVPYMVGVIRVDESYR